VVPEALIIDPELIAKIWEPLLKEIWEQEALPGEWKKGIVMKLLKKRDLSNCNSWIGITLVSSPNKILSRIILNRTKGHTHNELRTQHLVLSCRDEVKNVRVILEKFNEFQSPLYPIIIDFEKAFDSINRNKMWKAKRIFGLPEK
jgi:hypothetical protein